MSVDWREYAITRARPVFRVSAPRPRFHAIGAAAEPGWAEWASGWWRAGVAALHQLVYTTASTAATGVAVPREALDPEATRDYLIAVMDQLAIVNGWPAAEVTSRRAAMISIPVGATVSDTVARLKAFGPPSSWPGSSSWYDIADSITQTASLVSIGEASGVLTTKISDAVKQARDAGQGVLDELTHIRKSAEDAVHRVGSGVGVGLGITAGVIGLGALAWWSAPYWATAATAKAVGRH